MSLSKWLVSKENFARFESNFEKGRRSHVAITPRGSWKRTRGFSKGIELPRIGLTCVPPGGGQKLGRTCNLFLRAV